MSSVQPYLPMGAMGQAISERLTTMGRKEFERTRTERKVPSASLMSPGVSAGGQIKERSIRRLRFKRCKMSDYSTNKFSE